jgi:hypothetical protein
MKKTSLLLGAFLILGVAARVPAAPPEPTKDTPLPFSFPTKAPKGAIILLSDKADSLTANWLKRYSKNPANGTFVKGVFTPDHSDITSRQEFGDHFIHVEFRTPLKGEGHAGIGLQGRYEVQIYNTFEKPLERTNGAAFYSQTPAARNASKKPGEWQTYDIFFRAPRFDASGKVTENARASVFWNGILAQNNTEFKGPTGIQYGEFRTESPTGPIILQGDHEVVQYRNVWAISL